MWIYASGASDDKDHSGKYACPCATHPGPSPPAFVGNDYYCESGNVGDADFILITYPTPVGWQWLYQW